MTNHDAMIKAIEEAVDKAVEKSVNGKLRGLNKTVEDYITGDMQWKKQNQPALDNMRDITSGYKVILSSFGAVAVIAGAFLAVKKLFHI